MLAACAAREWRQVAEYDGVTFAGDGQYRATGIVAVRGDIRIHVEWAAVTGPRQPGGEPELLKPWQHRRSEIAIRHPGHDPADFAQVAPRRWFIPGASDGHRRMRIPAVESAIRLLGRDNDTLACVVLEQARR